MMKHAIWGVVRVSKDAEEKTITRLTTLSQIGPSSAPAKHC